MSTSDPKRRSANPRISQQFIHNRSTLFDESLNLHCLRLPLLNQLSRLTHHACAYSTNILLCFVEVADVLSCSAILFVFRPRLGCVSKTLQTGRLPLLKVSRVLVRLDNLAWLFDRTHPNSCIALSSSRNAVGFSSTRTIKRSP